MLMKPEEKLLRWTGGWRKIYGEAAQELGYRCEWSGGELLISTAEGKKIAYAKPLKPQFKMSTLIAQALRVLRRETADRKRQNQERLKRLSEGKEESKQGDWGPRRGVQSKLYAASIIGALTGIAMPPSRRK
jgi:hypothetical protein